MIDMTNNILPAHEAKLRVHGNGFLQAETACGNKFHIWDTRLPRQKVPTLCHNHNHGFKSTLLIGDLKWREFTTYDPSKRGAHPPTEAFVPHQCIPRKGKDTKLEPVEGFRTPENIREFHLLCGSTYTWPLNLNLYHEVTPAWRYSLPPEPHDDPELQPRFERIVSFVERGEYDESVLPTVLVPMGVSPDNEFDRYAHEEIATGVYNQAMKMMEYIEWTDI